MARSFSPEQPPASRSPLALPRLARQASHDGKLAAAQRWAAKLIAQKWVLSTLVLMVTLSQGLLYMFLLPPWQHYDEPTHFEYAWLIANKTWSPQTGKDEDATMRREVASSMLEHNFYWNQTKPALLSDYGEIWIGVSEVNHPRAYYMLVALPLRLLRHIDITSQLYVARAVSLLLFLLTIGITIGLIGELTPPGHLLRWALPLTITLIPTFADAMTSVNSDVGAVFVFSLFLWGCTRLLVRGITAKRVLWVLGTAVLAAFTKNTASLALMLAPVALLMSIWQHMGWRWRWLGCSVLGGVCVLALATLTWGDAATWYRMSPGPAQNTDTQVASDTAPLGTHVLALEATALASPRQLINPLLSEDVAPLAGKTITVGGWFWSNQPGILPVSGVVYGTDSTRTLQSATQPISLTTTPTFATWTFQLPADTRVLQYVLISNALPDATQPRWVYCDGAMLVAGSFPAGTTPVFDDANAHRGTWNNERIENLVRNASAEQAWPHLRPWLDEMLGIYLHRSAAQTLAALFDIQRNAWELVTNVVSWVLYAFFSVFAWGHITLKGSNWRVFFPVLAVLALIGCVRFLTRRAVSERLRVPLLFLGCAGAVIWLNTLLRPLPLLDTQIYYPVARYGFPCIIPTALALIGGTCWLWQDRWRKVAVLTLITGLFILNIIAVHTIWFFYRSLPV